jgi:hypothetical protein
MSARRSNPPFCLTGKRAPPGFEIRSFVIPAGCEQSYQAQDWANALVVVEHGELEIECARGSQAAFTAGAVLCFRTVQVRWLRNRLSEPVVLTALTRVAEPRAANDQAS